MPNLIFGLLLSQQEQLGGPGSGCSGENCGRPAGSGADKLDHKKGFSPQGVKQIDHYAKGQKDAEKLPQRVKDYPSSYTHEINAKAREYSNKITEKNPEDYNTSEYRQDMLDKLENSTSNYSVFEYRGDGQYHHSEPVSPRFNSSSQARFHMENNITEDDKFHGGKEGRGFVVRPDYRKS